MNLTTIGLDIAKVVFQIHGVDANNQTVLRKRLSRVDLLAFFSKLPSCQAATLPSCHAATLPRCLIGIEACSGAHHRARELVQMGHDVRLIPAPYVKPYVKRNKTDAADAEAICEAVGRPNMRFVPIRTCDQQAVLALHRVRSLLVRQRTAAVNATRGLMAEFGIVASKGIRRMEELRRKMEQSPPAELPQEARQALVALFDHMEGQSQRIAEVEASILAWHKANPDSQRLASAPGVGLMTATAIVAAAGDGRQFLSARHFAAWLGLTPRINASGGKERIGRISKGGDRYSRTLLIHGARAIVGTAFRKTRVPRPWLAALIARRPVNVVATAVAHKTARALWAMLTRQEAYRAGMQLQTP